MRALVTGALGFAGKNLVSHLLENGDEVIATHLHRDPATLPCQHVVLDITDVDQCIDVIARCKPDAIYHLAGVAFAPDCEKDFVSALAINVGGTHNIYRACQFSGHAVKIGVVSSGEVYGKVSADSLPITEACPVKPAQSYGLSKAMCELVVTRFSEARNIKSVIFRSFNHFGPGQRTEFVIPSFASQLAAIAKGKAPSVIRVGNLEAQRDFTDVRDIVRGYRLGVLKGEGVYNLCSGEGIAVRKILDILINVSGLTVKIEQDPARMRPAEVPVIYGSYKKAKSELGWEPSYRDLKASLNDVYQDVFGSF